MTFPSAGTWRARISDGFTDAMPHRISALDVAAAEPTSFPWPQAVMIAIVALLFLGGWIATVPGVSDEPREVGVGPQPRAVARRPAARSRAARATATAATSSTATATGASTRSSPTSTRAGTPFHVAIENWEHDLNIGTVVRNANAFLAAEVHIVGRRRWNRRGAMVTDRYQHVRHHADARRARRLGAPSTSCR